MLKLSETDIQRFVGMPELGMGYQLVSCPDGRANFNHYILLNCSILVSDEELRDISIAHRLSAASSANSFEKLLTELPTAKDVELSNDWDAFQAIARVGTSARWPGASSGKKLHSSPPFSRSLNEPKLCGRFSAFEKDRRVLPDGSIAKGTYVTSLIEFRHCDTGFGACGRYALPNPAPAIWLNVILAHANSDYLCGTVAPAFGQAGGGLEIELSGNATALDAGLHSSDPVPISSISWDEPRHTHHRRRSIEAHPELQWILNEKYPIRLSEL